MKQQQQQGQQDFKDVEARAAWARAWKVKCTECKSLISESADQYGFKSIENPLKQQEFLMMTQWSNGFFAQSRMLRVKAYGKQMEDENDDNERGKLSV